MTKSIYVGNLPDSVSEQELREIFEQHGPVTRVNKPVDRKTGRARGFAFVDMAAERADIAVEAVDGFEIQEKILKVKLAIQPPRP